MRIQPLIVLSLAVMLVLGACAGSSEDSDDAFDVGRGIYGDICSACHGNAGQGGVGPAMAEVVQTFPSCDDQIRWITLGSDRWRESEGPTYGATDKPIKGGMPPIEEQLTAEEIAAVAVYERVRFGSLEQGQTERDCGITPESASGE